MRKVFRAWELSEEQLAAIATAEVPEEYKDMD